MTSDAARTDGPTEVGAHWEAHTKPGAPRRRLSPTQVVLIVAIIGLAITTLVSWTAWTLNHRSATNEQPVSEQVRPATA